MFRFGKRIIIPTLTIFLGLLVFSCDAFFIPELLRTNPYDSEAAVAPVENLDARVLTESTVELSWTVPSDKKPASLTIVRNDSGKPQNINDGRKFTEIDVDAGTWTDEDLQKDVTYYYGIWSVSDEGLEVGPIHTKEEITLKSEGLYPSLDGFVSWDGGTVYNNDYGSSSLYISYDGTYYNTLIKFDFSEIPSASIVEAYFSIYFSVGATAEDITFSPVNQYWDDTVDYSTTNPDTFVDTAYSYSQALAMSISDTHTFEVTEMVNAWLGNLPNYGIRIRSTTNSTLITSYSVENDSNRPTLILSYYSDKYTD